MPPASSLSKTSAHSQETDGIEVTTGPLGSFADRGRKQRVAVVLEGFFENLSGIYTTLMELIQRPNSSPHATVNSAE